MAAQSAADGVNYDWWNEFLAQTSGVGVSFVPAILGFAAVMKNLSTRRRRVGAADGDRVAVASYMLRVAVPGRRRARSAGARSRSSAPARSSRRAASTSSGSSASA